MALPLPYRPAAVQELIEEELKSSLKVTVNKKDLFLTAMCKWYEKLSKKKRSVLTKKMVIRRSFYEAHRLHLPEVDIPTDWMSIMSKQCGLVCYISQRTKARREFRRATEMIPDEPVPPEIAEETSDKKKFIDLTSEPPPEHWTKAKENGKPLPRYLSIGSTETTNIFYWSYDTKNWKLETNVKTTNDPDRSPKDNLVYNNF